jgi:Glyoxalase-like domain
MDIRIQCLCVDSPDPAKIASFWAAALGWRRTFDEPDEVCLEPPAGSPEDGVAPDLLFLLVPEGKSVKNRLHLDLRPKDQAAEVVRLEAIGAPAGSTSARAPRSAGSCLPIRTATSSACFARCSRTSS